MSARALTGRMLQARGRYRRWLDARFNGLPLAGASSAEEPVALREVLVPAVLTPSPVSEYAPEEALHQNGRPLAAWLAEHREGHAWLVEGPAGSGKTTLLHHLCLSLAGSAGDALNQLLPQHCLFPLVLRELSPAPNESLEGLVDRWLARAAREDPELDPDALRAFLDGGLAVLCLDGLDEVLDGPRRAQLLRAWGASPWAHFPGNHLLVTARPTALDDASIDTPTDFQRLFLAPFDRAQVGRFLARWFGAQSLTPEARERHLGALRAALEEGPRARSLQALARRPAYLSSLAVVHLTRGALPSSRALLLDALVDASLDHLDRRRAVPAEAPEAAAWERWEKRDALAGVAWLCQTGAVEGSAEGRTVTFSREAFTRAVGRVLQAGQRRYLSLRPAHAGAFARWALSRTGILAAHGGDRWHFGHLSFQEFLAAVYVLDRASAGADKPRTLERMLFSRLGDPAWHDVALLALSLDASRTAGAGPHEALARLSPEDNGHRAFVGWTLAGEELPLDASARDAWVRGWALACARDGAAHYAREVSRHPANHRALGALWTTVADAVLEGSDPMALPRRCAQESPRPARTSQDPIEVLEALGSPTDPLEAPRRWGSWAQEAPRELFVATVLGLPAAGALEPPGARERLLALAERQELLQREDGRIPSPSRLWGALHAWVATWPSLAAPLARATPLSWVRAAQEDPFAAVGAVCFAPSADPLLRWRQRVWRELLALELAWCAKLALAALEGLGEGFSQRPGDKPWLEASLQLVHARTLESRARVQPVLLGLREARLSERLGEGYDAVLEGAPEGSVELALGVANAQALLSEAAALWGGNPAPTPRGTTAAWWDALALCRQRAPDPARDALLDALALRDPEGRGPLARLLAAAVFAHGAFEDAAREAPPDEAPEALRALRDALSDGSRARGLASAEGAPPEEVNREWTWLQRSAYAPERVVDRLLAWEGPPWGGSTAALLEHLAQRLGGYGAPR
ncbi:MAG: NACHT domain-containing protein [Deltaproteobacteria bacterium]|nr:NACHT domain-containing protein [Deltaproteobacteria bacterium]